MNMLASLCPRHKHGLSDGSAGRAAHGITAAFAATWMYGGYRRETNDAAEEALEPPLGPGGKLVVVRGCQLAPGPTQEGIGAAHGPRGQYGGSTGGSIAILECPFNPRYMSEGVLGHPVAPQIN